MTNNLEKIGFHKGSISTLIKEREEMIKIIEIINNLLKAHSEELRKMGIEITKKENKE